MNGDEQLFSASRAKDATDKTGRRRFMEYRVEILEVYSPAVHETVVVDGMPAAAAAAH